MTSYYSHFHCKYLNILNRYVVKTIFSDLISAKSNRTIKQAQFQTDRAYK